MPVCMCPCVSGGGGVWHTCLLHCCSAVAHMARGSVCLVLQAPAGRLESLTLSPPGEMWAWARNLHVTGTYYPTTPRLPIGTGRRWYVARLGSDPHSLTALGTGGAASRAGSGSHGRGRTPGRWRGTRAQSVLPCPGCRQCWLHWLRRCSPRRRGGPEGTTPEWPLICPSPSPGKGGPRPRATTLGDFMEVDRRSKVKPARPLHLKRSGPSSHPELSHRGMPARPGPSASSSSSVAPPFAFLPRGKVARTCERVCCVPCNLQVG